MQAGADQLVGFHDYRNFCKIDAMNVKNFERRILSFHVRPLDQSTSIFPSRYLSVFGVCLPPERERDLSAPVSRWLVRGDRSSHGTHLD
jgi:tRNA pseudouridine synthase